MNQLRVHIGSLSSNHLTQLKGNHKISLRLALGSREVSIALSTRSEAISEKISISEDYEFPLERAHSTLAISLWIKPLIGDSKALLRGSVSLK